MAKNGNRGSKGGSKRPAPVQHRSAISGRYVTAGTAKRHPKTTVTERRK
jgi:hypothetical protein